MHSYKFKSFNLDISQGGLDEFQCVFFYLYIFNDGIMYRFIFKIIFKNICNKGAFYLLFLGPQLEGEDHSYVDVGAVS